MVLFVANLENVTSKIKLNSRYMYDRSSSDGCVPNCEIEHIFRHPPPPFYWIKSKQFDGKSMQFSNHENVEGISSTLPIRYDDIFLRLIVRAQI